MSSTWTRRLKGYAAGIAMMCAAIVPATASAAEKDYPSRPITLIFPFAGGDAADVVARHIADELSKRLGQPVILENKPGAGGLIGSNSAQRAPNDGHTLLLTSSSLTLMRYTRDDVKLDLARDFEPISILHRPSLVLVANTDVPAGTIPELVDWLKKRSEPVHFSTFGVGSIFHLGGEMFARATRTSLNFVPYNGGAAQLTDLLGGRVHLMFGSFLTMAPLQAEKRVRILATTSTERIPTFPDVPTVSETVPGFELGTWYGLFAPKGTPAPIVQKLSDVTRDLLSSPEVRQRMAEFHFTPVGSTPEEARQTIVSDMQKWSDLVAQTGIRVEQ